MVRRVILLSFSLCFLCLKVYGSQETFPFLAESKNNKVNVRAGESSNFEKICQLSQGQQVIVLQRSFSWYKIRLPKSAKSFISDKYIKWLDDATGEVTAKAVNIRAGADVKSTPIGQLNPGDTIHILEKLPGWYRIEPVKESFGWVSDDFIKFKSKDISQYNDHSQLALNPPSVKPQTSNEKDPTSVTKPVVGTIIEIAEDAGFQLVVHNQPAFKLVGLPKEIFNQFQEYEVSVEGTKETPLKEETVLPVFSVNKVQLVF